MVFIIISASLFGISTPLAKILVKDISPVALAGFLYLGAFAGLSLYSAVIKTESDKKAVSLERKDFPWLAGAILTGGIIGPISMMMGLRLVSGFSASLLLNLEGVATAIIAVFFFKENAGKRLWLALTCMIIAGIFLTWDPTQGRFNIVGPLFIIFAMVCWGIDNNLTRSISDKDPVQISKIKGFVAGTISLSLALFLGIRISLDFTIAFALLLGSFSYGISLVFFIKALEGLGSSRTGAFFSFAPFIGAIASLIILREWIGWVMFPAAGLMLIGVWLICSEKHLHTHLHKTVIHTHSHNHRDMHHLHKHSGTFHEPHTHEHTHLEISHIHVHWPDTHHRHEHKTCKGD
ncbi:MAG: EamA family transporter [Candidatus Thermoplasmatota archaeon]|nr:EamA family transporter [Candidatus Thermoplasmatota archaeon]